MSPSLEPRGDTPFYLVPYTTQSPLAHNRPGWHLNTLIPTSAPSAEGLHKRARRPRLGPLQSWSQRRGSVISQPYNQPSSLANAEIDGRIAVNKLLIQHSIPVMSDPTQNNVPPRPSRAERTTTSCGECRRRKQRVRHRLFLPCHVLTAHSKRTPQASLPRPSTLSVCQCQCRCRCRCQTVLHFTLI